MTYKINRKRFAAGPSLVETFQSAKEAPMPKLNVKIRKSDLRIIDAISKQSGTPRSEILNAMIESILWTELQKLKADDPDLAALVAKQADALARIDYRSQGSWSDKFFGQGNDRLDYYYDVELEELRAHDAFEIQYRVVADRFARTHP